MYIVRNIDYYCNYTSSRHCKLDPRQIEFYHLTFILKGRITYIVDGVKYELHENDALLLRPGTMRERIRSTEHAHIVIFNFFPFNDKAPVTNLYMKQAVNQQIKSLLATYPYTFFSSSKTSQVPKNDPKMNCVDDKGFDMDKENNILPNILNCILIELFNSLNHKTKNAHVISAMRYINENIRKPLSLNDVSEAIHLSKEYTSKIFKKEMNQTISEYINEQKMLIAKEMLYNNDLSLREISLQLGYDNYGYFSRVFKKHFSISPMKLKSDVNSFE